MNFKENFLADSPFLKHHTKKEKKKRKKEIASSCGPSGCGKKRRLRKEGEVEIEEVEVFEKRGKKKGMDGKACWKGYKLQGTKMKGGKRVDNCVKVKRKRKKKK